MRSLGLDLRQSFRFVKAKPGFAAMVTLALGLGIGANLALFSVINSLLFRPLPYSRTEELVEIAHSRQSVPLEDLQRTRSFTAVTAFVPYGFAVALGDGSAVNTYGTRAAANLFDVLGVKAAMGRTFSIGDDAPGAPRPVVLSYEYWRTRFGDPSAVGRDITINGEKHTIVGVLAADFTLWVRDSNLFVPERPGDGRVIARLKPAITRAQAEAEVNALLAALPAETVRSGPPTAARIVPITEAFRPGDLSSLLLLQSAVALVLLITCANVGNLMLVRASARSREFAVRTALGAGTGRLARQLLGESLMLAVLGSTLGIMLAWASLRFVRTQLPASFSRALRGEEALVIDVRVLAIAAALAVATALLFGLAPAMHSLRLDVVSQLKESTKSVTRTKQRLGRMLVAAEIGLAVMLLIGAGLMIKSLAHLRNQNLGFSADHVLRAAINLLPSRYTTPERQVGVYLEIAGRLKALPGVESVGMLVPQLFPFGGPRVRGAPFEIRGQPGTEARAEVYIVNPEYFRAVRIPLLKGRLFTESDTSSQEPAALVSSVVAERYFGSAGPIGRQVRVEPNGAWITVIGVVGDVRNPVALFGEQPTLYRPFAQQPSAGAALMVRAHGDPMALTPAVQQVVRAIDPSAPGVRFASLERGVSGYISPQQFMTSVLGVFAAAGLLLSAIGVYGVMRYWVMARVPEMGIRMALGARPGEVFGLVLSKAAVACAAGIAIGLAGALALHRILASQLYGVSASDPAVFASVAAVMAAVALVAALLPARFAASVDPLVALRQQ